MRSSWRFLALAPILVGMGLSGCTQGTSSGPSGTADAGTSGSSAGTSGASTGTSGSSAATSGSSAGTSSTASSGAASSSGATSSAGSGFSSPAASSTSAVTSGTPASSGSTTGSSSSATAASQGSSASSSGDSSAFSASGSSGTSSGSGGQGQQVVYVSTYLGGLLGFTAEAATGALTGISGSPYAPQGHLYRAALHPAGSFVYAVDADANTLLGYRIAPGTGQLDPVAGSPAAAGATPITVAVDPLGRFVYVGTAASLDVFHIDPTSGAISLPQGSSHAIPSVACIQPSASGDTIYVTWSGMAGIGAYSVNPTSGTLTALPASPVVATGVLGGALVLHPNGRFLYNARFGSHGYAIQEGSGALLQVPGAGFDASAGADAQAIDLAMTPDGAFIYAVSASTQKVFAYSVDGNSGEVTLASTLVVPGLSPYSIAVEPGGRRAYVGGDSGQLAVLSIDLVTHALTKVDALTAPLNGLQPQVVVQTAR